MANGIIYQGTIDNTSISGSGVTQVYESGPKQISGSENAVEVVVTYSNQTPDPEQITPRYGVVSILEEEIGVDLWRPFFTQGQPFTKTEQGSTVIFVYGPNIFNFDDNSGFDMSDGQKIIATEYRKQGNLPTKFRVSVFVTQQVENGEPGAFESIDATISYKTYSV